MKENTLECEFGQVTLKNNYCPFNMCDWRPLCSLPSSSIMVFITTKTKQSPLLIVFKSRLDSPAQQAVLPPQSTVLQAVCGCPVQVQDLVYLESGLYRWSPAVLDWKCQWTHSNKPASLSLPKSPPGSTAWWSQPPTIWFYRVPDTVTTVMRNSVAQGPGYCYHRKNVVSNPMLPISGLCHHVE